MNFRGNLCYTFYDSTGKKTTRIPSWEESRLRLEVEALIQTVKQHPIRRIAVAAAGDAPVLQAVAAAYKAGIALPILCGDIEKIDTIARLHNIDISPFEIIETDSDLQAVSIAVSLVRQGRADMLMKGLVQTADLLRGVLDKETGLRGGGILSHVGVLDCPSLDRTLLITDAAIVPYPDLKTKVQLINNAVAVAHALGLEMPTVAPLAAVELVNPNMPSTMDAAALTVMNQRGQIPGCIVDGPLALDVALSPEAACHKGIASPAAGNADILLFHNIDAGNSTMKALTVAAGCLLGGVVMGASAPIVLTSRSDSDQSKLYSISVACTVSNATV